MRKALCSIGSGPHEALLAISEPTFRAFAERHGYDVITSNAPHPDRPPAWAKVPLIRETLDAYDLVLWIEGRRALAAGDTLIDRGQGFEFPADWANKGVPPEQILESLQPLLELPVELVLPTHGAPTDRAALEHALREHVA